jgi:hypothetical protein
MSEHTYKMIELVGSSHTSIEIKQPLFCKCRDELAGHLAFMFR